MPQGRTPPPLDDQTLRALRGLVDKYGQRTVRENLGLPRETLVRACGGLPVRPATAAVIRSRLADLERAVAAGAAASEDA